MLDRGEGMILFYIAKENRHFSISQHQNKTSRKKLERVIRLSMQGVDLEPKSIPY
jgi:hypothetical protein